MPEPWDDPDDRRKGYILLLIMLAVCLVLWVGFGWFMALPARW